jgi:PAS domain S-box-containing protein
MPSILVVEDERLVAKDIQNILTRIGYEVPHVVSTGEEAISKAQETRPDLVLMDIMLKGTIDGIETAGVMQGRFDIPVVYLTAFGDQETVRRARDTQPFGYLLKPFTEGDLRSAIEIALHKHEAEAKLRERERWFSTTLASIADAVMTTDADQKITFVNAIAEQLLGYTQSEARGLDLKEVFQIASENVVTSDLSIPSSTLRRKNGDELAIEHSAAPIVDDRGDVLGSVLVFRDVTQKKKLQEKLAISDRLASLGAMAAGVAHEINNPLAYMMTNMEFTARELSALCAEFQSALTILAGVQGSPGGLLARLEEIREAVNEAYDGADRVRRIVRDLKTFSHPDEKSRKPLDVRAVVELATRICASELRQRARLDLDLKSVPIVDANEARLGQVLVNLVMNAIQAIPEGNPDVNVITVATRTGRDGDALIEVSDTGSGIRPEIMGQIFNPFFTTKSIGSGMGLGLTICHRLVSELGGEITVHSEIGKGTMFRVQLPPGRIQVESPGSTPPRLAEKRRRVLVIDDERLLLVAIQRSLSKEHEVAICTDPREGLARILNGERFDAIVCDLLMPAMTGLEFHEQLLEKVPAQAARVLFLTGASLDERAERFLAQFPDRRLEKPFDVAALRKMINDIIG